MSVVITSGYKINSVNSFGSAPHSHDVISEIIQCFENNGKILINGELYNMKKNGLYFIHGLDTHFVAPEDLNRYNHSIINLNTPELKKLFYNLGMKDEFKRIFTSKGGIYCELTNEAVIEADKLFLEIDNIINDDRGIKYARLASALVGLVDIGLKYAEKAEKTNDKLTDIISFISDNALNKLTIDEICEKTHISKYHLCRIFKENMGVTIGEFIKNRRISVAKQLLRNSEYKIIEIAEKCGFSDSGFFAKVFLREVGITPSDFRKNSFEIWNTKWTFKTIDKNTTTKQYYIFGVRNAFKDLLIVKNG